MALKFFKKLGNLILQNVRLGFATNSSSSHSMVYLRFPKNLIYDPSEKPWKQNLKYTNGAADFIDTIAGKLFYLFAIRVGESDFESVPMTDDLWESQGRAKAKFIIAMQNPQLSAEEVDQLTEETRPEFTTETIFKLTDAEAEAMAQKDFPEFMEDDFPEILKIARNIDASDMTGQPSISLEEARNPLVAVACSMENGDYPPEFYDARIVDVSRTSGRGWRQSFIEFPMGTEDSTETETLEILESENGVGSDG